MSTLGASIMDRLKQSTLDLHAAAERHPFQRGLVSGALPRDAYVAFLEQMWLVHRSLEAHLDHLRGSNGPFRAVVHEYQYQEPNLRADLAHFGVDLESIRPTPATRETIEHIDALAASEPAALLGLHYVLEGSKNGAKYIARALQGAYRLAPGPGLRYYDPYGESLRERWQTFRANMDAVGFSDTDAERIVEAAKRMFTAIARISDDLLAARPEFRAEAAKPATA